MSKRLLMTVVALVIVIFGVFAAYNYVVQRPPQWLIKLATYSSPPPPLPTGDVAPLQAPEGFSATIFARNVPGARVMIRDQKGTMLVSQTSEGTIVALPDRNNDGVADVVKTVLSGLRQPHGMAVICREICRLYVAETNALKSYAYDADTHTATNEETLTSLPSGSGHFTRTLLEHPDGKLLLISVGSSCNVCNETDAHRAAILSFDLASKVVSSYADGLRNSVFMAIDPVRGEVWATDMARDLIGDDIPPDEVNIIRSGGDYGWPICYGANVHDTNFDTKQYIRDPCADMVLPHIELQAHSAPLGIVFVPEEGWPDDMRNDVLIAYHGSWNRSEPTGFKVVRLDLDNARNATSGAIDFLTGFVSPGSGINESIGRPVGLLAEPGGVLYVSDDRAGAIYKIARTSQE